jgi:hypothetical protein
LAQAIVRAYPEIEFLKPEQAKLSSGVRIVVIAIIVLASIVGLYLMTGAQRFFT